MFFIQACRGGECPGRPAPGWWLVGILPPALTFLFAPLRCYWIPWAPPSVHCCHRLSCSVSVSRCMWCAGTWAARGSQVGRSVHRHVLFSRLSLPSSSPSVLRTLTFSVLIDDPGAPYSYSFHVRICSQSLLPVPLTLAPSSFPGSIFPPHFHFFLFLLFSSALPFLRPFFSSSTRHAGQPCRSPRSALDSSSFVHPSSASNPLLPGIQSVLPLEEPGPHDWAQKTFRPASNLGGDQ